jgi:transcriptional regulator with XRE-family HTH domain
MPKTIHRPEYRDLVERLRVRREEVGLTQSECSKALKRSQSFMSDVENGSRRLDVVQLLDLCDILGLNAGTLIKAISNNRSGGR